MKTIHHVVEVDGGQDAVSAAAAVLAGVCVEGVGKPLRPTGAY